MSHYKHHKLRSSSVRLYRLTPAILLAISPLSTGQDYFDPGFLDLAGERNQVDLSAFANKGGVQEGSYTVSVYVNTHSEGVHTLEFRKNADNVVVPLLTRALLTNWGVNISGLPELRDLPADKLFDNLCVIIPQATAKFDLSRLRLDISIPQIAMKPNYTNYADPLLWEDGIPAFMSNYSFSAGRNSARNGGMTTQNNNFFGTMRSGLNAGPWRLRSTLTHTSSSGSGNQQSNRYTRLANNYLSRDIRFLRSSILIGESQTGSDIFDAVSFKGVTLSSEEQMLPSQLRGFSPTVSGVASSNARVTVRQSGNIVYETYVPPGPFYINDIQQAGMAGDYDVTVTESDGNERKFLMPYSTLPLMLRAGGWRYEISGGQYDGNLSDDSRRAEFMLATAVYGFPKDITLYGGTLVARDYQSISIGNGVSLGYAGALSADITHSNARFEGDKTRTGQSYRIRYSKSLLSTGTSVDLTALRYSTEQYYSFSEFNSEGYRRKDGASPWILQRRRSSFQTQLSQQMDILGSVHMRYSREGYWDSDKTLTGLSLGYSNSIKSVGIGVDYNIDRIKKENNHWPENRQLSLNISVPFSVFDNQRDYQAMYATTSVTHDNHGKTNNYAGLSGNTLDGNLNYSVNQSWGNQGQAANRNANIGYQGYRGGVSAGYGYSNNAQSMNMNLSGGMLIHSEGITLSRSLGDSVSLVSAPGASGVSVNGKSAITDGRGYAVVPYLSNYIGNSIGLDPTTLPDDIDLAHTNINVYPTKGAVVKAQFATRVGHKMLMTLTNKEYEVPFGAVASLEDTRSGEDISGIVGEHGQVYLTGMPENGILLVKWGTDASQQCTAPFDTRNLVMSKDTVIQNLIVSCLVDGAPRRPADHDVKLTPTVHPVTIDETSQTSDKFMLK